MNKITATLPSAYLAMAAVHAFGKDAMTKVAMKLGAMALGAMKPDAIPCDGNGRDARVEASQRIQYLVANAASCHPEATPEPPRCPRAVFRLRLGRVNTNCGDHA